jgi:hypothetical protein
LIDTGASRAVISPSVVRGLDPQPVASAVVHRAEAVGKRVFAFDIELKLDGHLSSGRWFELKVAAIQSATPGVDIVLGMDLLKQLHLYYSGPGGKLVLSY